MDNNDSNQEYWIDTASSVETNEIADDYNETTEKYSVGEACSIAHKYLTYKMSKNVILYFAVPLSVVAFVICILVCAFTKEYPEYTPLIYVSLLFVLNATLYTRYNYVYRREREKLLAKYGKKFVDRVSHFKWYKIIRYM